ncbi:motility protein MotB [Dyella monticola]|uniref:Motility protein MotB n=1 Tax=Dyella monticola TaxID=1927958 RepID=A0A370X9R6_9GAMM|nr:motility protein MotB [Dyella monticola]
MLIVVRRSRRKAHGHHGGAWKVAYADFVTAMMAFFLVMWLLGMGSRQQRAAIAEYFKNPSMTPGTATVAPPGKVGPGGASDSMIKLGGAMNMPHGPGKDQRSASRVNAQQAEKLAREQEKQRLDNLMQQLHAAIDKSQALEPFKDQLLLDITPEGLRIQIVDKQNRPMFDTGSATLKSYTVAILHELAGFINQAPNEVSISGHTDDAPYSGASGYSNWELSADRANAARRALLDGGMQVGKVARVVGLAASVPFDKANPSDPINRRISIIMMTKQAQDAALSQEEAEAAPPSAPTLPVPATIKPSAP